MVDKGRESERKEERVERAKGGGTAEGRRREGIDPEAIAQSFDGWLKGF